MSEHEALAKEYADKVLNSGNKVVEVDLVVRNISALWYKDQSSITLRDRNEIILYMLKVVIDDVISKESTDNASNLGLIAHITQQLQASRK
jgi:hypothetical protein